MARLPGATPARRTAWYGVVSASATIETSASVRPALASRALVDLAEPAARHDDVRGEAAVDVVARHLLRAADRRKTALAEVAFAARQHGRDDHRLADPALGAGAGRDDAAADLVAERERQRMVGPHAVVVVAEVGVADAAAGDRDDDLAGTRRGRERRALRAAPSPRSSASGGLRCSCGTAPPRPAPPGRGPKDPAGGYSGITVPQYRFAENHHARAAIADALISINCTRPPSRLTVDIGRKRESRWSHGPTSRHAPQRRRRHARVRQPPRTASRSRSPAAAAAA